MIWHLLSRLGANLGNWNDRTFGDIGGLPPKRRVWRIIDKPAGRLYVLGDRRK